MKSIFILLLLIFSFSKVASTQLRVVKDNINCAYGLKDQKGSWVIPAIYVLIEQFGGVFFKTHTENKQGVLDPQGKRLIPDAYDHISHSTQGYFVCRENGFITGYSHQGRVIFEPQYEQLMDDQGGRIILFRDSNATVYSKYIDTSGRVLIPETLGRIETFGSRKFTLIKNAKKYDNSWFSGVGIIDLTGKIVVPCEYHAIATCNSTYTLVKENRTLVVNQDFEVIHEFENRISHLCSNDGSIPCVEGNHLFQFYQNGKLGIINKEGEIILPPEYDYFERPYWLSSTQLFLLHKQGKIGLGTLNGKIVCEAIYDSIAQFYSQVNTYNSQVVYLVKLNGKIGLISASGTYVLKPEYSRIFKDYYTQKNNIFFSNGFDLYALDPASDSLKLEKAVYRNSIKDIRLYEAFGTLFPFFIEHGKNQHLKSLGYENSGFDTNTGFLQVYTPDGAYLITSEGKLWSGKQIRQLEHYTGVLTTKSYNKGIMNLRTKKLILDTIFQDIYTAYQTQNMIWVQCRASENQRSSWQVYDTVGKLRLKEQFDTPFYGINKIPVHANGFKGILDSNFRWIIPPRYLWISAIAPELYVVYTSGKKFGVFNSKHELLLDTVYESFRTIFEDSKTNFNNDLFGTNYYLFQQGKMEFVYSNQGYLMQFKDERELNEFLSDQAFLGRKNVSYTAFKILTTEQQDSVLKEVLYRSQLYAYMRKVYDLYRPCPIENPMDHLSARITTHCSNLGDQRYFTMLHAGKRFCSLTVSNSLQKIHGDMDYYRPNIKEYASYIWKEDTLKKLQLNDIFGTGEALKTELIASIQARDDVELDCSNIDVLISHFGERFAISQKGILMYYDPNGHGFNEIEFLIPIERLSLHAESSWIVEYLGD